MARIEEFCAAGEEVRAALDDLDAAKARYQMAFKRLKAATAVLLVNIDKGRRSPWEKPVV